MVHHTEGKTQKNSLKMINTTLEILRNHPDMNNHIAELLILWRANVDQKSIETYEQLVQYIFKYVMKPEETSDFMSKLKKALAKKIDDVTPLNKTAQKVLMSSLGQRDLQSLKCPPTPTPVFGASYGFVECSISFLYPFFAI